MDSPSARIVPLQQRLVLSLVRLYPVSLVLTELLLRLAKRALRVSFLSLLINRFVISVQQVRITGLLDKVPVSRVLLDHLHQFVVLHNVLHVISATSKMVLVPMHVTLVALVVIISNPVALYVPNALLDYTNLRSVDHSVLFALLDVIKIALERSSVINAPLVPIRMLLVKQDVKHALLVLQTPVLLQVV